MTYLKNVSTLRYNQEKCAGCGRCVEVCPQEVFEMRDRKAAVIDKNRCMECGACALNCEFGALAVNAGVGCAAAVINSFFSGGEPVCGCSDDAKPVKTAVAERIYFMKQIHPQYEARANIIKAIGHPTRLFILEELYKQETMC